MRQSKVYVVQQPTPNGKGWTPNLGPATQFGRLTYIFHGGDSPKDNVAAALQKATDRLADFDPENDFVLWVSTGDPTAAWVTMIVLGNMDIDFINILNWERKMEDGVRDTRDGFYTPVHIPMPFGKELELWQPSRK